MKNRIFNNETQVFFSVLKFGGIVNRHFAGVFEDKTIHIIGEACFLSSNTE
jgi:hypothetical protein